MSRLDETMALDPTLSGGARDVIDDSRLEALLDGGPADPGAVRAVIEKSASLEPLTIEETALLLRAEDRGLHEEIFEAARALKKRVYGNRIVLFAPLYVGSLCRNDCTYCGFRRSNPDAVRVTLSPDDLRGETGALVDDGHKRLILVFGEHPRYSPEFIAESARAVYDVKRGHGEIRRVNINAAPLDHRGFRVVKAAGIGTYQIFQETYHHATYARVHPARTRKGDYLWRLDGPARAIEAGCDDVGIGALFGLHDWRFEVLGLVAHANDLRARFGVGPHTVSFPRLRPAAGAPASGLAAVSDEAFERLVAILRLAVPYTGLILTAREAPEMRRRVMGFGVSQIDAGSHIELGGYARRAASRAAGQAAEPCVPSGGQAEQFSLGDTRALDPIMRELLEDGYVPSFCTACYRLGRTGEHFMEFAIPGFIERFCTPNALLTLTEYLDDYASPETRAAGERRVAEELARVPEGPARDKIVERLKRVREGLRDVYF